MSATPAPLTPADITALLGDGWRHEVNSDGELTWGPVVDPTGATYVILHPDEDSQTADLEIGNGETNHHWNVPADSKTTVAAVLTLAGLIPGQVSVTQPDDDQRCPNCAPGYDCQRGIYAPPAEPAEPRVWNHGDDEPGPEVRAVLDRDGDEWMRTGDGWAFRNAHWSLTWDGVLVGWGPLTEALTEVVDR